MSHEDLPRRLKLDQPLAELLRALQTQTALSHVDPARVLFVAGAARLRSKASIRPLTFGDSPRSRDGRYEKPEIRRGGSLLLYEVCLRPAFFLRSGPDERLGLIIHELLHASPRFDGTLDPDRRHSNVPARELDALVSPIRAEVEAGSPSAVAFLGHRGEVTLSAWLHRPPSLISVAARAVRTYDERDLYEAILEMS